MIGNYCINTDGYFSAEQAIADRLRECLSEDLICDVLVEAADETKPGENRLKCMIERARGYPAIFVQYVGDEDLPGQECAGFQNYAQRFALVIIVRPGRGDCDGFSCTKRA